MKNTSKYWILFFILFSNLAIIAQGDPGDEGDGGLEGGDPMPGTPINTNLIILAVFGVFLAFSLYRKTKKANAC